MSKLYARSFYASKAWRTLRKQILRRDLYTCADCYGRAEEVHHIIELTPQNINDPNVSLNPDNLISLCGNCHKRRTLKVGDIGEEFYFDEKGYPVKR